LIDLWQCQERSVITGGYCKCHGLTALVRGSGAYPCCPEIIGEPEIGGQGITVPDRGTFVDDNVLGNMIQLKLPESKQDPGLSLPRGIVVH